MEQWVQDGRDIIRRRTFSFIPPTAEDDGFREDLTQGLRGILRKVGSSSLQPHDPAEHPKVYAECRVAYSVTYKDIVVDEQTEAEPMEFVAGGGQVMQGMEEGVLTMAVGETAEFLLDPGFAYRDRGFRPKAVSSHTAPGVANDDFMVPPDAVVTLKLKLLSFENPLSPEEKLQRGAKLKAEGNDHFAAQQFGAAIKKYREALSRIGSFAPSKHPVMIEQHQALRASLLLNIATCQFKQDELSQAIKTLERVLDASDADRRSRTFRKALFRRAEIHNARGDDGHAAADIDRILQLLHDDKQQTAKAAGDTAAQLAMIAQEEGEVRSALALWQQKRKSDEEKHRAGFQKMFQ